MRGDNVGKVGRSGVDDFENYRQRKGRMEARTKIFEILGKFWSWQVSEKYVGVG